ncbi:Mu transposase C-terminal domain-containing protein [Pseudomonas putida]|uniref:Mu transposase C-terminal domain-containing protein n=1 Tax=Pseudomonas putida TaxID=303 RepID=UPI002DBF5085|nr:Mu transposase C-terminal domain-containing protein [Pseudomonas putida]WRW04711.1 Mu transposase C-terminal domain-containing protein [Pseudomonas putida]
MRNWFTAQELAGLPGMPGSERGVKKAALREGWEGQGRLGSKAVEYSFAVLPAQTQAALLTATVSAQETAIDVLEESTETVLRDAVPSSRLSDDQRGVMTARLAFVREIERMSKVVSQQRAIMTLVGLARDGQLSPYLKQRVERANDRKTTDRSLSERTLKRWLADYRREGESGLAPGRRKADMTVPAWAVDFLRCYQRPTKPAIERAYAEFAEKCQGDRPSIHQVRRFLDKLSPEARERGRHSPQELKAFKPFRRRTTKNILPGDVYTADGHKFDAEVINPHTGKPYRPEITTTMDVATRRVLGVAIGESENTIDVMFSLRDAIQRGGMFALFYVDNGSGFANDAVREVVDRLGGEMVHALPYNSQARGLIERAHQSIWVAAAKKLTSYIGADMDSHAGTKVHRISRKELREVGSTRLIPTHAEFMAAAEIEIEDYNNRPHRGLAKIADKVTGRQRHMSPNEAWEAARATGWEPMVAPAELVSDLMRPQVVRRTSRGEITWDGNRYFLNELRHIHGDDVRIAYDVRDASRVWVRTMEGELIGEALLDGNASDYMPLNRIEKGREKRAQGQLKRGIDKLETLTGQRVELVGVQTAPEATLAPAQLEAAQQYAALSMQQPEAFDVPGDAMARYELWQQLDARQQSGDVLSNDEARWHTAYPQHSDFKSIQRMFETFEAEQARA